MPQDRTSEPGQGLGNTEHRVLVYADLVSLDPNPDPRPQVTVASSSKHVTDGSAAPSPPDDHAADRLFDRQSMEDARDQLRRDQGGGAFSMILLNVVEYQARKDGSFYRWDGEGWWGGDLNRLVIKSEGREVSMARPRTRKCKRSIPAQ